MIKQKNEGMCFDNDGISKFSCDCKPQYLGERCEDDRCDVYQCQNNGTCIVTLINEIPTPKCECQGNYSGAICNLDLCSGIECDNGTCIRGTCQCNTNYVNVGNSCEQTCALASCKVSDIIVNNFKILAFSNELILSGKKNGGTCFDDDSRDRFSCECVSPFGGETCEINLCDGIQCKNGGICMIEAIEGIRTPNCKCPDNTEGEKCEDLFCGSGTPCYNNGTCIGEKCQCTQENGKEKFHGENCEIEGEETCKLNPCKELIKI